MAKVKATLPRGTPIEIWFQDEARVGQKNKITRRWARRGTRPSAPKDQRTKSAYIFGAICPEHGKGAGLVLPFCNTEADRFGAMFGLHPDAAGDDDHALPLYQPALITTHAPICGGRWS